MSLGRQFVRDAVGNYYAAFGPTILKEDPPPPDPPFIFGVTRPVKGVNVGPDLNLGTPEPYTGPNAGGILTVTSPTEHIGIDFAATDTRLKINTSDYNAEHCIMVNKSLAVTGNEKGPLIDFRGGTNYRNRRVFRCSFDNAHQWSPVQQAIMGYGFRMERCQSENFQDHLGLYCNNTAVVDIDVEVVGNYLGPMSFWRAPTGGVVHSSDTKSHNDSIQWHGGRGMLIEGNDIPAIYSTTIGTGTPNSGNNRSGLGTGSAPYTQATGEQYRYEVVEGSGLYSPGKPGALLGGSLSAIMCTPVGGRNGTPAMIVKGNWGQGGAFWLNAGSTSIVNASGIPWSFEITENKIDNNQRQPGWAFGILAAISARVPQTGLEVNLWTDGSGVIPRRG